MKRLALLFQIFARVIHLVFKTTFSTNPNKIVFLSRQSNSPSIDFQLVVQELQRRHPDIEVVFVCRRMEKGYRSKLKFAYSQIYSLYHLATSRVAVLESYWPAVSAVQHRPEITVFQMWHSMGKIKASGRQTVGKPQGWNKDVARLMRMHEGYDYVIAGGKAWNAAYEASFGIDESKILNLWLPRADYLLDNRKRLRKKILARYPQLANKPVVLYAPTFRRGGGVGLRAKRLVSALDLNKYELIVKGHSNSPLLSDSVGVLNCQGFSGMELLAVADFVITDYSAIAVEAAVVGVKTFYYLYDYDVYQEQNGLNLDIPAEFPELVFFEARSLVKALDKEYPTAAFQRYRDKYLFENLGHSTQSIVDAIDEKGKLCLPL